METTTAKNTTEMSQESGSALIYSSDPGTLVDGQILALGAAEKTYAVNHFDPSKEDSNFSYTPGRVVKNVFNKYQSNEFQVACYYTDWSQYDSRYETSSDFKEGGRGIDLMRLQDVGPFDKIIIGFAGIIGDTGEKAEKINAAAQDFGIASSEADLPNQKGRATFTDAWGDVLSYINCGFNGWISNDPVPFFNPAKAQGVLGGLVQLKQSKPDLRVSLSLGGWTMSQAFHFIAADPKLRARLVQSLKHIVDTFPIFTDLDLDWEFPGCTGNGNSYGPEDAPNFAQLVRELKMAMPDIHISIAVNAEPEKMQHANIPELIAAGVEGLNMMSYDFFGSPWAEGLGHQANLQSDTPSQNSAARAVEYLLGLGVNPKKIFLGYAAYTRNAKGAGITSVSPLQGNYDNQSKNSTVGSFESGSTEWPDIVRNYIDFEQQSGRNGFQLYTDTIADADFLFNSSSQVFMSLDTPRSVRAKAQYVKEKGLGGLFVWTGDGDNGLLTNAAREGLGCKVQQQIIDMTSFYFSGITQK
ncbi:glycosyl hydrolase family 18 protein [Iodobacter fluviatilis]|uniref:chitinase n=1 Tax=Iodobacter fluviatilis TaxID=537 RepID=A0A377Q9E1_9NEIS|nr:glycosyl hydrolase family 18 protein [Iodobacter fluviatilis]TCU88492.1 chitinase (glycosyl hydrolase family 18) [Iodobacter fluviatilis]STQ91437.1 Chitinase A precursor [Iodobacter fluviatilis]